MGAPPAAALATPAPGVPRRVWLVPALVAAALYAQTLRHDFPWDDELILRDAAFLRDPGNVAALVTRDYFASGEISWRPFATLTHLAEATVTRMPVPPPQNWERAPAVPWSGGLQKPSAIVFHATNVALHALAAALCGWVAFAWSTGPGRVAAATIAGCVFAVHPVCTEAVCVSSFREDLLACVGMLGALACLVPPSPRRPRELALGWTAAFVAIFSKESALLLPPVLLLAEALAPRTGPAPPGRLRLLAHGPVWGLAIAYAALRFTVLRSDLEDVYATMAPGLPYRLWLAPALLLHHARLLGVPLHLCADYFVLPPLTPWEPRVLGGAALGVAAAAATAVAWRRGARLAILGAVLVAATLAPVSNLLPLPNPLAERYLYAAVAGVACVVAECVARALARGPQAIPLVAVGVAVALGGGAVRTLVRVPEWRDSGTIWEATRRSGRTTLRTIGNEVAAAEARRDRAAEIAGNRRMLALFEGYPPAAVPTRFHAILGMGQAYRRLAFDDAAAGRPVAETLAEAARWLAEAHAICPGHFLPLDELGVCARQRGDPAAAREWFTRAIALVPPASAHFPHAHLAVLCEDEGDLLGAVAHYRRAVASNPWMGELHRRLGLALVHGLDPAASARSPVGAEAAACWREAARCNPWEVEARYNLGVYHLLRGEPALAFVPLQQAFVLQPDDPAKCRTFGDAAAQMGDRGSAIAAWEAWAAAAPGDPEPARRLRALTGR